MLLRGSHKTINLVVWRILGLKKIATKIHPLGEFKIVSFIKKMPKHTQAGYITGILSHSTAHQQILSSSPKTVASPF
jgi:hypothetical protein